MNRRKRFSDRALGHVYRSSGGERSIQLSYEHAWLMESGRAEYVGITDQEALAAFHYLCRTEGIIPALESSHAIAYAMKLARTMRPDQKILVNLSGRGDKDIGTVADLAGVDFYDRPSMRGLSVKGASK